MPQRPDIHRLLDLQELLLQFRAIQRVMHVPESRERENDTEHSYNLALTAWFLCGYFPALNKDKVLRFALAHDLVEIHAGDTYIYAEQPEIASKQAREAAALEQLAADWADFPDLIATIHDYETKQSDEAKFVYALDKIMPIMVIYLGDGYTWKKHTITVEQLHAVKHEKVALSPEIEPYYKALYQLLLDEPGLFDPAQPARPSKQR